MAFACQLGCATAAARAAAVVACGIDWRGAVGMYVCMRGRRLLRAALCTRPVQLPGQLLCATVHVACVCVACMLQVLARFRRLES